MLYINLMDMHTHTDNSPDAIHSSVSMCEKAFDAGLRAIAITDHCECNAYEENRYDLSIRQSIFEAYKAKAAFAGRLVVVIGVELGQPLQNLNAANHALSYKIDFVLASLHNLSTHDDFYCLDYNLPENDPDRLFSQYLDELKDIVDWGNFDSLAHLTYPLRYIKVKNGISLDIGKCYDRIDSIFKCLAESGKALEINTSGLRQEIKDTMPSLELLKRFKAAGGEYITIGSDAHSSGMVGSGIKEGLQIAEAAGFKYITIYQSRTPIQVPFIV